VIIGDLSRLVMPFLVDSGWQDDRAEVIGHPYCPLSTIWKIDFRLSQECTRMKQDFALLSPYEKKNQN
jgi:hypothetical protein